MPKQGVKRWLEAVVPPAVLQLTFERLDCVRQPHCIVDVWGCTNAQIVVAAVFLFFPFLALFSFIPSTIHPLRPIINPWEHWEAGCRSIASDDGQPLDFFFFDMVTG